MYPRVVAHLADVPLECVEVQNQAGRLDLALVHAGLRRNVVADLQRVDVGHVLHLGSHIHGSLVKSTLPPVTMTPTRLPRNVSGFFRMVASGARARRLHHDLHPRPDEAHGVDNLLFRGCQDVGHVVRHEVPGQLLERHPEPVRHRVRRIVGNDVPGAEASRGVIRLLGLGGVDLHLRCDGREGQAGCPRPSRRRRSAQSPRGGP